MLKKVGKVVRKVLRDLKVEAFRREDEAHKIEQETRRIEKQLDSQESDHKTLATITDDGVIVDYMDGRNIGQRGVSPNFVRPFGMRRGKW
jgi:uncharacterized protein YfeS